MSKFILSIAVLLMVACNSKDSPIKEIQGLWCGEHNHCIYFQESKCIIYHAKLLDYEFLSENKIAITSAFNPNQYDIEIKKDTIRIREVGDSTFRTFHKPAKNNNKRIEEFYCSQISAFSEFDFYLNKDGRGVLEMGYHKKYDAGTYVATVPKEIIELINELVHQMQLDVSPKLNSRITSDIQEWGIKIKTDQTHFLYHNYEGVDEYHHRLAFFIDMLPHLLDLKIAESEISLDEIRTFRHNEFERNVKESNLK